MSLFDEMESLERKKFLEILNEEKLPFPGIQFVKNEKGRFKEIGGGGGGTVYACQDSNNENCVIKVVGFRECIQNDDTYRNTLLREAYLQTKIAGNENCYENIVQIKETAMLIMEYVDDEEDDGCIIGIRSLEDDKLVEKSKERIFLFMLMEKLQPVYRFERRRNTIVVPKHLEFLLPGNKQPFNEQEILRFALDIGNALLWAHELKVANRDVKPANIYWDEKTRKYKLGDFGTARVTKQGQTRTRARNIGTDGYIAPEAESANEGDYDPLKADIYSFGVTLYQLLNNFEMPSEFGNDFSSPCHGSEELHKIIKKACSFKPEGRYGSMEEMYRALMDYNLHRQIKSKQLQETKDALQSENYEDILHTPKNKGEFEEKIVENKIELPSTEMTTLQEDKKEMIEEEVVEEETDEEFPSVPLTRAQKLKDEFPPVSFTKEQKITEKKLSSPNQTRERQDIGSAKEIKKEFEFDKKEIVGGVAFFIVCVCIEIFFGKKYLPDVTAWQTYVAIILAIISSCGVTRLFHLPTDKNIKKAMVSLLLLLSIPIAIGFQIYCCFALGVNWLFVLMILSAVDILRVFLVMSEFNGLQWAITLAAIVTIPISILDVSVAASWYWIITLLVLIGGYTSWCCFFDICLSKRLLVRSMLIVLGIVVIIEGIIWYLSTFSAIEVPLFLTQLHLIRVGLVFLVVEPLLALFVI